MRAVRAMAAAGAQEVTAAEAARARMVAEEMDSEAVADAEAFLPPLAMAD